MKQLLTLLLALSFGLAFAQTTFIYDAYFEQALIEMGLDTGIVDGSVPTANIDTVTSLDLSGTLFLPGKITNLTGIQGFTALTYLDCSYNNIDYLYVANNKALTYLNCEKNQI